MTMKSGMIPSWVGMAIVAMTKIMSLSRPWNRSFANAYPAMVENVTREIVTIVEMRRLFPRAFQNGIASSTVCTLAKKFGPGMNGSVSQRVGEPHDRQHEDRVRHETRLVVDACPVASPTLPGRRRCALRPGALARGQLFVHREAPLRARSRLVFLGALGLP